MKPRVLSSLLLACIAVSLASAQSAPEKPKFSQPIRKFRFTYSFTVKDIPPGTKVVRVWAPVAHTDEHQTVRLVSVKAPVKTEMTQEAEYGNRMMYAEVRSPVQGAAEVRTGVRSNPPRVLAWRLCAARAQGQQARCRAGVDDPICRA